MANNEVSAKGDSANVPLEERWRRHNFLDGLYRFYLEKIITFHSFYLPIVGGVVAYVITKSDRLALLGLFIPFIVSVGAVWIFWKALHEARELDRAIQQSAESLNILATHARILVRMVAAFLMLHVVLVAGLLIIVVLRFAETL